MRVALQGTRRLSECPSIQTRPGRRQLSIPQNTQSEGSLASLTLILGSSEGTVQKKVVHGIKITKSDSNLLLSE